MHCATAIDILQHPSETRAAKNTARICKLCLPQTQIWLGEGGDDFYQLRAELVVEARPVWLLYPGKTAQTVAQLIEASQPQVGVRLLLLDATWKKAYKMWRLNPWLERLPQVSLSQVESNYRIRKSPKSHYLSTLEAVAYSLAALEPGLDTGPLFQAFNAMQAHFQGYNSTRNSMARQPPLASPHD
jgi:DTW domain-containing protein YfiP